MIYNNIKITGHQRTGTHYIAALICLNFLDTKEYVKYYANHKMPSMAKNKNIAYIYTWRDFDSTSKSVIKMRGRFGLQTDSYDEFLNTKYSVMWADTKYIPINVKDLYGNVVKTDKVSTYFRNIHKTPKEWWSLYYQKWDASAKSNSNIIRINYNDVMADFDKTLLELSVKLGSKIKIFEDIKERVGWYV